MINEADYSFVPDEINNRIIYSFKAINGINKDVKEVLNNRPYKSFEDFLDRTDLKPKANIALIKAGAFTELDNADVTKTMEKYIRKQIFTPCNKLTLSQLGNLRRLNLIPKDLSSTVNCISLKKYILDDEGLYELVVDENKKIPKSGYHDRLFILDDTSMPVFKELFSEDSIKKVVNGYYVISEKLFTKECKTNIKPLMEWMDQEDTLNKYNEALFNECWNTKVGGSVSQWEMDALGFYHEHELNGVDLKPFGVVNFFELPEEPVPYEYYPRYINGERKMLPKNKIDRIAGTVINKDNQHNTITLLTLDGVVQIKIGKGQYAFYNRRISDNGKVVENSWFKRGTKLLVCGYRRGSQFIAYKYNDTIYKHTVVRINNISEEKQLSLDVERYKVQTDE